MCPGQVIQFHSRLNSIEHIQKAYSACFGVVFIDFVQNPRCLSFFHCEGKPLLRELESVWAEELRDAGSVKFRGRGADLNMVSKACHTSVDLIVSYADFNCVAHPFVRSTGFDILHKLKADQRVLL